MADEVDFCAEMRSKTQKIHDISDKLINLKLAVVLTDTTLWGHVLADFYFVFQAIENSILQQVDHEHVGPLHFPDLARTAAFENDLEFYLGKDWRGKVHISKPAEEYCKRIENVAENNPTLLIAYAHSMYLALLAGGQIIKRIVKKTLGISGNEGLAIFDFEDMNRNEVRKQLVSNINNMHISREKKDEVIQEKIRVFSMNNAIASNVKPSVKSFQRIGKLFVIFLLIVCLSVYFLCKILGIV